MPSQLTKADFRREADALRNECRLRRKAREAALREAQWLLSNEPAESIRLGLIRERT